MTTITEGYVSFETAKLLKEKGFDKFDTYGWDEELFNKEYPRSFSLGFDNKEHWISCPTHQTAMRWLRDKHNLFIFPFPQMNTNKFWAEIYQLSDNQEWKNLYCESIDLQDYKTYEEAVEAALKYALENLI